MSVFAGDAYNFRTHVHTKAHVKNSKYTHIGDGLYKGDGGWVLQRLWERREWKHLGENAPGMYMCSEYVHIEFIMCMDISMS